MKILYLDMDGVIANFEKAVNDICPELSNMDFNSMCDKVNEICKNNNKIFHDLEPIKDSIKSVKELFKIYDIYFLSTPMWDVPESFTGKRIWIEKHFGNIAEKRLILTHRKDLVIGDILVDDMLWNGVDKFRGVHIHFGTYDFPDWKETLNFLKIHNKKFYEHTPRKNKIIN